MRRLPNRASRPLLDERPVWLATAAALLIGLVLLGLNLHLYFSASQTTGRLEARKKALETERDALVERIEKEKVVLDTVRWKKLTRRVDRVNLALAEHRFSWIGLLHDVGEVLPWQVRLVKIAPRASENGLALQLVGEAQTSEAIIDLLQNLIDSPHFENPLPRSEESPEGGKATVYGFKIDVQYLPGVKP